MLGNVGISGAAAYDLRRTASNPAKRPASAAINRLDAAADAMVKAQTGRTARPRTLQQNEPVKVTDLVDALSEGKLSEKEFTEALKKGLSTTPMASVQPRFTVGPDGKADIASGRRGPDLVNINPHVSEELLAHELGHSVFGETKVGDYLQRTRLNPKLSTAIQIGGGLTALAAAGLTPGDDDLDEAIIGSLALNAPTLIDEAAATRNALAMMKQSGLPATIGQKGRLAGAYLSYLAAPASTAVLANTLGNQFDEDLPMAG